MKKLFCIVALLGLFACTTFANMLPPNRSRSPIALTTIYTLKAQQISEVALIRVYNVVASVPRIGGSVDFDAFAGLSSKGAVSGAALVYSRQLSEHVAAQLGLAATLQNKSPTDFGILFGIAIKL